MLLFPEASGLPPLDRDRRWRAVIALNGLGAQDADELRQRELASDPSDNGRRLSMAAEAAWPSEENKSRWLDRVRDTGSDLSLARRRAVMANLFPLDQYALSASLASNIVDSLPGVGADQEDAFLLSYGDLIPKLCRPESVRRLADAIERYGDLNPILLKALKVAHQEDARCLEIAKLAARGPVTRQAS
jgi:aminopeptidase N